MKIALIQLNVKAGDPARNVRRMIKYINKAKAEILASTDISEDVKSQMIEGLDSIPDIQK